MKLCSNPGDVDLDFESKGHIVEHDSKSMFAHVANELVDFKDALHR